MHFHRARDALVAVVVLVAAEPAERDVARVVEPTPDAPDAVSIQPHPEFSRDLAEALVDLRAGTTLPTDRAEAARKSFGTPVAGLDFARWSLACLNAALSRRAAA